MACKESDLLLYYCSDHQVIPFFLFTSWNRILWSFLFFYLFTVLVFYFCQILSLYSNFALITEEIAIQYLRREAYYFLHLLGQYLSAPNMFSWQFLYWTVKTESTSWMIFFLDNSTQEVLGPGLGTFYLIITHSFLFSFTLYRIYTEVGGTHIWNRPWWASYCSCYVPWKVDIQLKSCSSVCRSDKWTSWWSGPG